MISGSCENLRFPAFAAVAGDGIRRVIRAVIVGSNAVNGKNAIVIHEISEFVGHSLGADGKGDKDVVLDPTKDRISHIVCRNGSIKGPLV